MSGRGRRIVGPLAAACLLVAVGGLLSGCVVVPAGPGWCYWHPYRCR